MTYHLAYARLVREQVRQLWLIRTLQWSMIGLILAILVMLQSFGWGF